MKERLKTLALVLLAPLTLFTAVNAWSSVGLRETAAADDGYEEVFTVYAPAAMPETLAQTRDGARKALMWSPPEVAEALALLSPSLSEALGSALAPSPVSSSWLRSLLAEDGVYMSFAAPVPLQTLGAWYSAECSLPEQANALLLTGGEGGLRLTYITPSGAAFTCQTAASPLPELDLPDDCAFAFEWRPPLPAAPAAHTLLPAAQPRPSILTAQTPDGMLALTTTCITMLAIDPNTPFKYEAEDGTVNFVDYRRQCVISPDGRVYYADPYGEGLGASHSLTQTLTDAVEQSRRLCAALAPALGAGAWSLYGAEEISGGFRVVFRACAQGVAIEGGGAPYAIFVFRGGLLSQAQIKLRSYAATEERAYLMPLRQSLAAAAGREGFSLCLRYEDDGAERCAAAWTLEG
jgi:hypothetical protein